MPDPTLIEALRRELIQRRFDAGLTQRELARTVNSGRHVPFSELEKGTAGWSGYIETRVSQYAEACGVPAIEIWRSALNRWQGWLEHPEAYEAVLAAIRAAEEAAQSSQKKRKRKA